MAAYYTVKLWWLSGNTLETRPFEHDYDSALKDFRRTRRNPAVKKVIMQKHSIISTTVKIFKRSGIKNGA